MTVSVLIPFASDDPQRIRCRDHVAHSYSRHRWQVISGGPPGPWCKAAAVAYCLEQTTGDILVIADADSLCDRVADAVEVVELGAPWSMPHERIHRLTMEATNTVLAGEQPSTTMATVERHYPGKFGGGIVVLPRDTYQQIPLDHRFIGWGQEDDALGLALDTLAGPCVRLDAPLFHLWHQAPPRATRVKGNDAGWALYRRYAAARRKPDAMRALIDEQEA